MKKATLFMVRNLLAISLLLSFNLFAKPSEFEPLEIRTSLERTSIPTFIQFNLNSAPSIDELDEVLAPYLKDKQLLGLHLEKTERDNIGQVHYRYAQTYKGKKLMYCQLMVHTVNGMIYSMNGKLIDSYPTTEQLNLSEAIALEKAMLNINAKRYKWELAEEEKQLKREMNDLDASYFPNGELVYINSALQFGGEDFELAYKFNIYAQEPLSRNEVFVSATSGEILFSNNLIHTANSRGTANTVYSGVQSITTDSTGVNSFSLNQTLSGSGVNTYDMNRGTSYGNAVPFTDTDNIWNNVNGDKDQYATDAHWGAEKTYDYYFTIHGRNSINNNGFPLNSYIHYDINYSNAFWDGQRMTYGDGNGGSVTPLVALDIAGHEISHGLTTFTANLVYASESGALNESFSDIFGTAIEFFAKPGSANWTIGENIGSIIRSMSNPRAYGDPDTKGGPSWFNTNGCTPSNQNDQCGVHSNSGVQNRWFYLLTTGGSGTNGIGNSYTVNGLGIDTAAMVAFRNLTVYLGNLSDYDDARFYSIRSAIDLFGPCSRQVESVTNAWYAVGVGGPYFSGISGDFIASDTVNCVAPFTVNFQDNSQNALTFFWEFGDGGTSVQRNPNHTYQSFGQYSVKLVVDGGLCGTDSIEKINHINLDSTLACTYKMINAVTQTSTECSGTLFDSGGSNGDYYGNETSTFVISPSGAATVSVNFASFDIEAGTNTVCNWDYLEIFDGPSVNSTSLGRFCNTTGNPGPITSTQGSITVRFYSDQAVEESGFEMNWTCNYPTTVPTANFTIDDKNSCLGEILFYDNSTNLPVSWLWDFGDGTFSNLQNPVHEYTASRTYTVKLTSTNSFGSDSIVKSNFVTINRPTAPTSQNQTFCLNQPVKLYASGTGDIRWYNQERGGNLLSITDSLILNPFNTDTSFWVQDYIEAPTQSVGPANNSFGAGGNFNNEQYLIFDVYQPIILKSVRVYSATGTSRAIELRDANGVVLQTKYIYISQGLQVVNINMEIDPGVDLQLGVAAGSNVDMYRNSAGASYPYNLPGLVSIKRSSASTGPTSYYYFFYDWKVKALDCSSQRVEVFANIDTSCTITGINEEVDLSEKLSLYPNPAAENLTISFSHAYHSVNYEIYDMRGRLVYSQNAVKPTNNGTNLSLNLNEFRDGIYHIKIQLEDKTISKSFAVIK